MSRYNSFDSDMSDDELSSTRNESLKALSKRFVCEACEHTFASRYSLQRHDEKFHTEESEDDESDASSTMEDDESDANSNMEDD